MGLTDSPHNGLNSVVCFKGNGLEDSKEPGNTFGWERVVSNLPGMETYYCCQFVFPTARSMIRSLEKET